jgi:hypothetical protein
MKKIFGLLGLILVLNACSDGDVKVQNISFEQVTTVNVCNNNYFKINGTEMLLLRINDPLLKPFPNEITTPANGTTPAIPRVFNINANNKVIYRNYNGAPTANTICDVVPPATPTVLEEWNAVGGTIEITTTAVKSTPDANNAVKIIGYNHFIVFKNLIFQKPVGTQAYGDDFRFGNYVTPSTLGFPTSSPVSLLSCNTVLPIQKIFYQAGIEGLLLSNLDANLIQNSPTTTVRTSTLGTTNNVLTIKSFNSSLPQNYFCNLPATPTLLDTWNADIVTTGGTIEVTTTVSSGIYTHKIHLKNVTIKKAGNYPVSFYLGNDYYLGDLSY